MMIAQRTYAIMTFVYNNSHVGMVLYCEVTFVDGYCSTAQGLLDWFEVDLGSTELLFIQIGLCVVCVFVLYSRVSLSSIPLSSVWPQHMFVFVSTVLS